MYKIILIYHAFGCHTVVQKKVVLDNFFVTVERYHWDERSGVGKSKIDHYFFFFAFKISL
jgi:hypothetical protein